MEEIWVIERGSVKERSVEAKVMREERFKSTST